MRNDGNCATQAFLRDSGDVLAVDHDTAFLHVVKSLQQAEQRRLSAA